MDTVSDCIRLFGYSVYTCFLPEMLYESGYEEEADQTEQLLQDTPDGEYDDTVHIATGYMDAITGTLSPSEIKLFLFLSRAMSATNMIATDIRHLSKAIGLSQATTRKAMTILRHTGLIARAGKFNIHTIYMLNPRVVYLGSEPYVSLIRDFDEFAECDRECFPNAIETLKADRITTTAEIITGEDGEPVIANRIRPVSPRFRVVS
jgi:hypothetical protein